jgi:hypothetical protein
MAYILFVNPIVLGRVVDAAGDRLPFPAVLTSTALVAAAATLAMGLLANLPLALAAGMGLNSVVAFQLVGTMRLSWPEAMGVVVVEGLDAYGFAEDARRVAEKFLRLQVETYERTGQLWEKYNVVDGSLDFPLERYRVPPMHGWSSASVAVLGRRAFGAG